jgi:Holliday junction resolvasome RuvABC endonuclease subunit
VRLLACDPSSTVVGLAYFDHEGADPVTAALRANRDPDRSWLERMEWIAKTIQERSILWAPDVVAMEDVAMSFQVARRNPATLASMAESRGYLRRVFTEEYKGVEFIDIHLATERKALGIDHRADRKTRQAAARARFPQCTTQDEADAAVIGIAAYMKIAQIRAEAGV